MNIDEESGTTLEDLRGDLAQRHKWTPSSGSSVDNAIVEADLGEPAQYRAVPANP